MAMLSNCRSVSIVTRAPSGCVCMCRVKLLFHRCAVSVLRAVEDRAYQVFFWTPERLGVCLLPLLSYVCMLCEKIRADLHEIVGNCY